MLCAGVITERARNNKYTIHGVRLTTACKTPSHTQSTVFYWLGEVNRSLAGVMEVLQMSCYRSCFATRQQVVVVFKWIIALFMHEIATHHIPTVRWSHRVPWRIVLFLHYTWPIHLLTPLFLSYSLSVTSTFVRRYVYKYAYPGCAYIELLNSLMAVWGAEVAVRDSMILSHFLRQTIDVKLHDAVWLTGSFRVTKALL